MKADLHIHSTASDGRLSPKELVRQASQMGLTVIALTDHDSVDGVPPALDAARAFPDLEVIPGVEIGTDVPHGEVHVLGYFVDYKSAVFLARLEKLRHSRRERAFKMVAKLRDMGMPLDWERVQELAGNGSIGRPHIALALHEKGYVPTIKEAFNRYIGRDGPAYVEREKLTPVEAVGLIAGAEGLAVLAHPAEIDSLGRLLLQLKESGLVGMEAYYGGYSPEVVQRLEAIAKQYDIIPCGGSDYHGLDSLNEAPMGSLDIPRKSVERLRALARKGS